MSVPAFLLAMTLGRIFLMIGSVLWLIWTTAERAIIIRVLLVVCMVMLGSNLINATLVVAVLQVSLW